MTDHQPIVIWCPNCGDSLVAQIEIYSVNKHGDREVKVQFSTLYISHFCEKTKEGT